MKQIRIATRTSQLALWQAHYVRDRLLSIHPDINVEIIEIVSQGDKTLDIPLAAVGGKGLFLKELEQALLDGEADIAVHSMKDVTVNLPQGLCIPVICPREDPRDAFVSNQYPSLDAMPPGSIVGTCSLRRQSQISAAFPELVLKNLRGNVNTRLAKLDANEYDGLILAASGLIRLAFQARIRQSVAPEICLPAVGQGAVGIECRESDVETQTLIAGLADRKTTLRVSAERAANAVLGGGCHVPVAAFAEMQQGQMHLRGLVASLDGSQVLQSRFSAAVDDQDDAVSLGRRVAEDLLQQGAKKILDSVYANQG